MPDDEPPYPLLFSPAARRALSDDLPSSAAFAAWEFISGTLARRPHAVGTPLRAPFAEQWRARRGEYQVRYLIDDERHEVRILDIEHRRDAYRS